MTPLEASYAELRWWLSLATSLLAVGLGGGLIIAIGQYWLFLPLLALAAYALHAIDEYVQPTPEQEEEEAQAKWVEEETRREQEHEAALRQAEREVELQLVRKGMSLPPREDDEDTSPRF